MSAPSETLGSRPETMREHLQVAYKGAATQHLDTVANHIEAAIALLDSAQLDILRSTDDRGNPSIRFACVSVSDPWLGRLIPDPPCPGLDTT